MLGKTNVKVKPNKRVSVDYVEYIEATGTQYIDTGLSMKSGYKVEIDFAINSQKITFGSSNLYNSGNNIGVEVNLAYIRTRGSNYSVNLNSKQKYTLYINFDSNVNYELLTLNKSLTFSYYNLNYFLFACNENNSAVWNGGGIIYGFRVYDGEILIRDLRPTRDGAGIYCLYDKVEKRYYYNQGSGLFTGGDSI